MSHDFTAQIKQIIERALEEDIGGGDATTRSIIPPEAVSEGKLIAKEDGIIAGLEVARWTFLALDATVQFSEIVREGELVQKGQVIARISGSARALLSGERVALNFLQRMSGIATLTRKFVDAVQGTATKITDTRKTAPGLRLLDKWAVRLGGGENHRFGLYDMVLIKENHIAAAGGLTEAVLRTRARDNRGLPIEVEVKNLSELQEALALRVDRILLDNMNLETLQEAVRLTNGRIPLEASGNISLQNVAEVARTGVDYISVGMLTHSVKALDISFCLNKKGESRIKSKRGQ